MQNLDLGNVDLTIAIHEDKWLIAMPHLEKYAQEICYATLQNQAGRLLEHCPAIETETLGLALVFTNSSEVQHLNNQFRGKDYPTNVLSFAADMEGLQPDDQEIILGDVIFAYQVIDQEAIEQGKTLKAHLTHMIIHGLLHLLGFDHITEIDAQEMEKIECNILEQFNITDPYFVGEQQYDINQLHGT